MVSQENLESVRPPLLPALLMGIGFGGFVDGIVFHQILQWHHMLTSEGCCSADTVGGLEDNTLVDGFFHVFTWLAVLVGTVASTRAWQRGELAPPWRLHVGGLLLGWGGFNLVEGIIDHQILRIHHVRDDIGAPVSWDIGFSASARPSLAWDGSWCSLDGTSHTARKPSKPPGRGSSALDEKR